MPTQTEIAIAEMLTGFATEADADKATKILAFSKAAHGVDIRAIREAAHRFAADLVPRTTKTYAPSSAEFVAEARRLEAAHAFARRPPLPAPQPDAWQRTSSAERDRMKLKMPLWQAAIGTPRINELADLVRRQAPLDEYMALAQTWGVPIPEALWTQVDRGHAQEARL